MNTGVQFITHLISNFLPETKFFGLKNSLHKWMGVSVGKEVRICSSVRIRGIGKLILGQNVWLGHDVRIMATAVVEIEKNVGIGPNVSIINGSHEIDPMGPAIHGKGIHKDIFIGEGSMIATGAILLLGTRIGKKSIVAPGSVVKGEFPPYSFIGGSPAKLIKSLKPIEVE